MKKTLEESFKCRKNKYFNTLYTNGEIQNKIYRQRLIRNHYAIVEARSNHTNMIEYVPTKELFENVIKKYDINSIFQSLQCFAELIDLNECSIGGCAEEFSIWCSTRDFPYIFSYNINFKTHKTTYEFKPKGAK